MKKYLFVLMILPVILLFTAVVLHYASGPYWISYNSDPAYLYFVKFLATTQSKETLTTGNPGTTLQMIGAATIKIVHALGFSKKESLEFAVLRNPEFYLTAVNGVLVFLNVLMLFIVGFVTVKLTENIWLGLLLQFSPFFSNVALCRGLISVSPETLFLFLNLLLILVLVLMIFSKNLTKSVSWYMIALSIICGFGLATKLTFCFLLIIPFIVLPGMRNKLGFLLLTIISFILGTWPIISQYKALFEFCWRILTHTGYYGFGESGIINIQLYFMNMKDLFLGNPLFFFILLSSIIFIFKFRRSLTCAAYPYKILVAVTIAQLTAVLVIPKHGYDYYLLPVLNLTGFSLFLMVLCLQRINYFNRLNMRQIAVPICIFFILCSFWRTADIKKIFVQRMAIKQESLIMCQIFQDEYKNYLKIIPLGVSCPIGALAFGNYFLNNGLYSETLHRIYGEKYFYNGLEGKFHTWTKEFFIEDFFFKGYANKIISLGPADIEYIDGLCKTGSLLHCRNILMGEYGGIFVLEKIVLNAGKFQRQSYGLEGM